MALTDKEVRALTQGSRRYRVSDGGGLLLEVDPAGGKYWLWRHRYPPTKDGRRQDLRIGPYPRISLKAARDLRDEQKRLLYEDGINPCDAKKRSKDQRWGKHAQLTFEAVALDWHATKTAGTWTERHSDDVIKKLNKDIFPAIGGMAIDAITAQDCLAVLRSIEQRGSNETAKRSLGVISQVLDYAVAIGHCTINPAHSLKRHAPVKQTTSHYPCIAWSELPELLSAMRANSIGADASTLNAMGLLALTFVRTSELIAARWEELDLEEALWTIPAERMKGRRGNRREHLVPLSRQAAALFQAQYAISGPNGHVFQSQRTATGFISNNTVNMALKRMGFDGRMCGHGFRALAMTNIQEQLGIDLRIVDRQLAHIEKNKVMEFPSEGGLLLDPVTDLWADWGLLGVPDPDRATTAETPRLFRDFIGRAFPGFQFTRFSELLIDLLQQVADGELTRLIVCCPPRHGKSQLVSRLFPAYWVSRHPQLFCAIASYSAELAYAHSREARHYYRLTGHALSKDAAAVGNWLTPQRGGCIAAGVRGPFTGKGYNLGIIDDPYKGPEDAKSALQRERLIDWLKSVWFTRAEPGQAASGQRLAAAQVVVQTRWDHQDMTAWLLAQEVEENPEHWTVLNLPAIAEPVAISMQIPQTCTRVPDWRQPGEPLCPERVPLEVLQRIRTRLGSYWWNALYQQQPSPAEGLLFRKAWIHSPLPTAPGQARRYAPLVLSCDLSFKDGKDNDACGFALLGLLEPQRHPAVEARRQGLALATNAGSAQRSGPLTAEGATASDPWAELQIEALWAHRQRLDLPGVIKFLLASLASLELQGLRPNAVLIEDAANGPAVCQLLKRQVPGLIAIPPKGSKASRAHAVAPLVEAGQVRFHRRSDSLIEELLAFSPRGGIDDQVDAFCQGVLWIEAQFWRGRGHSSAPLPMVFSR